MLITATSPKLSVGMSKWISSGPPTFGVELARMMASRSVVTPSLASTTSSAESTTITAERSSRCSIASNVGRASTLTGCKRSRRRRTS